MKYAIRYKRTGAGRTFLVMDKDKKNHILGYFTIGLNTLHFEDGLDDVPKAYEGMELYSANYLPVNVLFLISKNGSCPDGISMSSFLKKYGLQYIDECKKRIGGSILYIDCIDELVDYYKRLDFEHFGTHLVKDFETSEEYNLNTMIRSI